VLARGFPHSLVDELIRTGPATANTELEMRRDKPVEIIHIKLTKAGRAAVSWERSRPAGP
jgi:hypothetical protein